MEKGINQLTIRGCLDGPIREVKITHCITYIFRSLSDLAEQGNVCITRLDVHVMSRGKYANLLIESNERIQILSTVWQRLAGPKDFIY